MVQRVHVIDSHTGGEPTRVVIAGGPELGSGDMASRRDIFRGQHDDFRRAVIKEPRGWDAMVGALLCEPVDSRSTAGVIFFHNGGYLGMSVHGTLGVVVRMAHWKSIEPREHCFETPVGNVWATLHETGQVSVRNVISYRLRSNVTVSVEGFGEVTGDVAWGGNWFFLVDLARQTQAAHGGLGSPRHVELGNVEELTQFTWAIRQALIKNNIAGEDGAEIDHIELFGPPTSPDADSKNFVLCPGKAYDRSPCGTGTSAKVACLYADGKLMPGDILRQESITGSIFQASLDIDPSDATKVIPTIKGSAYVTAEATLYLHPDDPFRDGISSSGGAA